MLSIIRRIKEIIIVGNAPIMSDNVRAKLNNPATRDLVVKAYLIRKHREGSLFDLVEGA